MRYGPRRGLHKPAPQQSTQTNSEAHATSPPPSPRRAPFCCLNLFSRTKQSLSKRNSWLNAAPFPKLPIDRQNIEANHLPRRTELGRVRDVTASTQLQGRTPEQVSDVHVLTRLHLCGISWMHKAPDESFLTQNQIYGCSHKG